MPLSQVPTVCQLPLCCSTSWWGPWLCQFMVTNWWQKPTLKYSSVLKWNILQLKQAMCNLVWSGNIYVCTSCSLWACLHASPEFGSQQRRERSVAVQNRFNVSDQGMSISLTHLMWFHTLRCPFLNFYSIGEKTSNFHILLVKTIEIYHHESMPFLYVNLLLLFL
jgi:hypothetical protein